MMTKSEIEELEDDDHKIEIPIIKPGKIKKFGRKSRLGVKVTRNPDDTNNVGDDVQEPADLKKYVEKVINNNNLKYNCTLCNKFSHKSPSNAKTHLLRKHFPTLFSYNCEHCESTFTNIDGYSKHKKGGSCPNKKQGNKTTHLKTKVKENKFQKSVIKYKCEICHYKSRKESRVKIH